MIVYEIFLLKNCGRETRLDDLSGFLEFAISSKSIGVWCCLVIRLPSQNIRASRIFAHCSVVRRVALLVSIGYKVRMTVLLEMTVRLLICLCQELIWIFCSESGRAHAMSRFGSVLF